MTTTDGIGSLSNEAASEKMLTPAEAAQIKNVARATVYKAISKGALAHVRLLGRLAIRENDVLEWSPDSVGGPRNVKPMTEAAKEKLSKSQKERWRKRKVDDKI